MSGDARSDAAAVPHREEATISINVALLAASREMLKDPPPRRCSTAPLRRALGVSLGESTRLSGSG